MDGMILLGTEVAACPACGAPLVITLAGTVEELAALTLTITAGAPWHRCGGGGEPARVPAAA